MSDERCLKSDILKQTVIDETGPGTILADFQTLLDFIGNGIKTGGKNYRIPLAALNDLDERMVHPLRPKLARPQQISYPHINGLYLLLRSTGLGVTSGQDSTGRLLLMPDRLAEWNELNRTERYMTLLESLINSTWEFVDSNESSRQGPWYDVYSKINSLPRHSKENFDAGKLADWFFDTWRDQTVFALMELFGIVEITRGEASKGKNWEVTSVHKTEFGEALLTQVFESDQKRFLYAFLECDDQPQSWIGKIFVEYFPECQKTLGQNEEMFVDGVWEFKVSLAGGWRRIQIPAGMYVEDLVDGILDAFKFGDEDHLFEMQVRDRSGRSITIGHPELDGSDYFTDEYQIGSLPLEPGQSMTFLFDFGDDWRFNVKLEKILPPKPKMTKVKVTEKHGQAPKQYSDTW